MSDDTIEPDRPVLLVPGIVGTFAAAEFVDEWYTTRGIEPEREIDGTPTPTIEVDPLAGFYDDLIATFENVGYERGQSLFVVNYDWRLNVGPLPDPDDASAFDGTLDVGGAEAITDGEYRYGVDYLGYYLAQAVESWEDEYDEVPESVDVVAHSTGGLVTRSYIQSDAYGDVYDADAGRSLPYVDEFVQVAVPNRGASKAWNPLHDNFVSDEAYRVALSKIAVEAFTRLTEDDDVEKIAGADHDIYPEDVLGETGEPEFEAFIPQYVPTIRNLLATYPFFYDDGDGEPQTINHAEDEAVRRHRNDVALALNAGLDLDWSLDAGSTVDGEAVLDAEGRLDPAVADPSSFVEKLGPDGDGAGHATVIYSGGEETVTQVTERTGYDRDDIEAPPIVEGQRFLGRYPESDERWYEDLYKPDGTKNGDGTVPLESSVGQYALDPRFAGEQGSLVRADDPLRVTGESPHGPDQLPDSGALDELASGDRELDDDQPVDHTGIMGNALVQQVILERFVGTERFEEGDVVTGETNAPGLMLMTVISRGVFDHLEYPPVGEALQTSMADLTGLSIAHEPAGSDDQSGGGDQSNGDGQSGSTDQSGGGGQSDADSQSDDGDPPGVIVGPHDPPLEATAVDLGDGWSWGVDVVGADVTYSVRFQASEDGGLEASVEPVDDDELPASAYAEVGFTLDSAAVPDDEGVLYGHPDRTRFSIRSVEVVGQTVFDDDGGVARIGVPLRLRAAVDPRQLASIVGIPGLLQHLLPGDPYELDFELLVGWSSSEGLFLETEGPLAVSLPLNLSVGPVHFEELFLALQSGDRAASALPWELENEGDAEDIETVRESTFDDEHRLTLEDFEIVAATTATVEVGPVTLRLERIGVTYATGVDLLGEDEDADEDGLGFEPPDAVGVEIDTDAVTGAGYLYFDPEVGRYEGRVQLAISDFVFTATGLLDTDPDGDGYSLLVLISADIPDIDLGNGFTLEEVGGVLGIHRAIDAEALADGVQHGGIENVLFPEGAAEDAPELVSDLETFFPIKSDNYVFGPLARIGWGTPTLLTADAAILMDVPVEDVVVLGQITADLPKASDDLGDDRAPISLRMNVAGGYTRSERRLWISGALLNAKIGTWDVDGGVALEHRGAESRFFLSIGGFHDDYEPPGDFVVPKPVRFGMSAMDGDASVELEAFFALTTNTVQAGAHLEARLDLSIAEIVGELWFDTLIQFDPFEFVANVGASLEANTALGTASIGFDGTLTGPNPYHLQGEADLPVGSKTVEVTFGDEQTLDALPPADVLAKLVEALEQQNNWSAQRADAGSQLVTLRDVDAFDRVLVHPLGQLTVRQTVVPLETEIETFGEARPEPHTEFDLTGAELVDPDADVADGDDVDGSDLDLTERVEEEFAPAAFEQLTDAEKLEAEPAERKPAGRRMTGAETTDGRADACQRAFVYDEVIEDEAEHVHPLEAGHARATIESTVSEIGPLETEPAAKAAEISKYTNALEKEALIQETIEDAIGGTVEEAMEAESAGNGAPHMLMQTAPDDAGDGLDESVSPSIGMRDPEYLIVDAEDLVPVGFEGSPEGPTSLASAKRALRRLERLDPAAAEQLTVVTADRATGSATEVVA